MRNGIKKTLGNHIAFVNKNNSLSEEILSFLRKFKFVLLKFQKIKR